MKKRISPLLALCGLLVLSQASFGATIASDNASNAVYSGGTFNGLNGGTGFGAWNVYGNAGTGGFDGSYVGTTGGLGSPSFGIYAGDVNTGAAANAVRPFTGGSMTAGQTFSVSLGHSTVGTGGLLGVSFQNSGFNTEINLQADGTNWTLNAGGTTFNIAPDAANTPFVFTLTYNGGSSYSYKITGGANGNNLTATSTISDISQANFFDFQQGSGQNFGFNNLSLAPEPSSFVLMSAAGVASLTFLRRRRR